MKEKILGIIGIRSGSTGIKDKNIKLLNGKPLVYWIIKAAKKSKLINRIIVSTDSPKYAKIVKKFGAEVPFIRPKKFAKKNSPDIDYVKHVLIWLKEKENYEADIFVRLMATSPLQRSKDIDCIIKHLKNKSIDSSVIVSEAKQHPKKALQIKKKGKHTYLVGFNSNSGKKVGMAQSRHIFKKAYFRANAIASRPKFPLKTNSLTGDKVKYHIVNAEKSVDIDSKLDFKLAEFLIKNKL